MIEKDAFLDTEKRWRDSCRTEGASAAQSSAHGLDNHVRSAYVRENMTERASQYENAGR
jgi:hypothetical protein